MDLHAFVQSWTIKVCVCERERKRESARARERKGGSESERKSERERERDNLLFFRLDCPQSCLNCEQLLVSKGVLDHQGLAQDVALSRGERPAFVEPPAMDLHAFMHTLTIQVLKKTQTLTVQAQNCHRLPLLHCFRSQLVCSILPIVDVHAFLRR